MNPSGGTPAISKSRHARRYFIRIALSLSLLGGLLLIVDVPQLFQLFSSVSVRVLIVILVMQTCDRLLMAFKWWLLLERAELRIRFWEAVRSYYISSFAGLFLPMTLGADAVRTLTLRTSGAISSVVATIALERGIGAVAHAMWCVVSVVLLAQMGLDPGIPIAHLGLLVAGLLIVTSIGLPLSFKVAEWVSTKLRKRGGIGARVAPLASAYAEASHEPRVVWTFLALTVFEGAFPIIVHYLAATALGVGLPFRLFLAIIPIVYLVGRLPISLGGIGVVEGTFVLLGTLLGIELDAALAIAVLSQVTMIVILLPGAVAYSVYSSASEAQPPAPTARWRPDEGK